MRSEVLSLPVTIKKTIRVIVRNSFTNNTFGVKEKDEVKEAEKKAHKVDIMTKTSVRKSSRG